MAEGRKVLEDRERVLREQVRLYRTAEGVYQRALTGRPAAEAEVLLRDFLTAALDISGQLAQGGDMVATIAARSIVADNALSQVANKATTDLADVTASLAALPPA